MLEHAETSPDIQTIISWQPHGRSFKIKDKTRLQNEVLPLFFASSQYDTFRRNLNHWGFRLVNGVKNPDCKSYYHKLFLRSKRDLCSKIKRVLDISSDAPPELTSSKQDVSSSPSHKKPFFSEPNFHEMEWLPSLQQNTDDISSIANVSNSIHSSHHSSSTTGSSKSIINNSSSHSAYHVSNSIDIPSSHKNRIFKEAADSSVSLEYIQEDLKLDNNVPSKGQTTQICLSSLSQENRPNTTSRNYIQEIEEDSNESTNIVQKLPAPSLAIQTTCAGNKSSDINQILASTNEVTTTLPSLGTKRKRRMSQIQYEEEAIIHYLGDDFWDEQGWGEFLLEHYFLLPRDLPKLCTVFETT